MVDSGCLESICTGNGTVGSNPTPAAFERLDMNLKSRTQKIETLTPVQDSGAANYFNFGISDGEPCYAEGYVTFEGGGGIKIPGSLHMEGFDNVGESVDITVEKYDGSLWALVTTNLTKKTVNGGELTLYYK